MVTLEGCWGMAKISQLQLFLSPQHPHHLCAQGHAAFAEVSSGPS